MEAPLPGPPLRIAVLGDFEGPHTRRWLRVFVERGHEVHAISYYPVSAELPGVMVHVLSGAQKSFEAAKGAGLAEPVPARLAAEDGPASANNPGARVFSRRGVALALPANLTRLIHAMRYRRAGLKLVLERIQPDVFHAHYVVEHGFYGASAGFHPYIVSAWGSDVLLQARTAMGRRIARYALSRADLVTAQDPSLAARTVELGVPPERVRVVRLGIDALFFDGIERSVNVREDEGPPTVISDRALEPLYNVDVILRAFARVHERLPAARLLIAHEGSEGPRLVTLARELGMSTEVPRVETRGMAEAEHGSVVQFVGRLAPEQLHEALLAAHVYVSAPRSDAFALSTMEAMASGAFPVVGDLLSVEGMIVHGENGLRVPVGDVEALSEALFRALSDRWLRRGAAPANRALVEAEGRLETNMLAMERLYYRLAGHPVGGAETI